MNNQLYTTNEPQAEEIHELLEIGMLNRVEIDKAALMRTAWDVFCDVTTEGVFDPEVEHNDEGAVQAVLNMLLDHIEGGDDE